MRNRQIEIEINNDPEQHKLFHLVRADFLDSLSDPDCIPESYREGFDGLDRSSNFTALLADLAGLAALNVYRQLQGKEPVRQ